MKKTNEKTSEKKIDKNMTFAEIMQMDPGMQDKLMEMGLGCCGCPMSEVESLEGGAYAHGINPDALVEEINKKIEK